jgi:hypothetical protein
MAGHSWKKLKVAKSCKEKRLEMSCAECFERGVLVTSGNDMILRESGRFEVGERYEHVRLDWDYSHSCNVETYLNDIAIGVLDILETHDEKLSEFVRLSSFWSHCANRTPIIAIRSREVIWLFVVVLREKCERTLNILNIRPRSLALKKEQVPITRVNLSSWQVNQK